LFRRELRILLSSIFGEKNPFGFAAFSCSDVEDSFLEVDVNSFLRADITLSVAGSSYGLLQAVKVWPLQGPNPHKFHLSTDSSRRDDNENGFARAFGHFGDYVAAG
jgi:hypothetical protein